MTKTFGTPLPIKSDPSLEIKDGKRWEISEETKEAIRKIEENIRYANFMAPFIRIG